MDTEFEERTAAFAVERRHAGGVTALRAMRRLVPAVGGVGALLRLRQSAGRHGVPVVIEAAAPRVRHVLQLVRLDVALGFPRRGAEPPSRRSIGLALSRCA